MICLLTSFYSHAAFQMVTQQMDIPECWGDYLV